MKSAVLLMAIGMSGTLCAANFPFVGDWKLDPSRTRLPDTMKVAHVSDDKYAFDFGGGAAETIAVDGNDHPGVVGTTLSVTVQGPDSWKVVRKKDGRTFITATWSLSKDGNTLMDAFMQIGPDGSRSTLDYVYKRTAGESGFAGTWESTSLAMNSDLSLKIQPYEEDGLSFADPLEQASKNLKLDGREYSDTRPNLPAGLASSARRIDERTLEITDTFKGRPVATEEMQLSRDGKTLTMTVRTPGGREPNILVFERQ